MALLEKTFIFQSSITTNARDTIEYYVTFLMQES